MMVMTSPEALRRRQFRLGITMLILGCLTIVWGIVLEVQSHNQRQCLQDSLHQLNDALTIRSDLNEQRNKAIAEKSALTDQQVDAQRQLIKTVSSASTQADVQAAFTQFAATDAELTKESAVVDQQLKDVNDKIASTPVPDFPEGKCS